MGCLFLYGLVDTLAWTDGGDALRRSLAGLPGVDPGDRPGVREVGRLGIVLSTVKLDDFTGPRFEANLEDVSWIEPRARAHAGVVAATFSHQAVLPMRFGTLFSSVERLRAEFAPREETLMEELTSVQGYEEWTIRFCANPEAVLEQMVARAQVASEQAGRGAQYLLRRQLALKGRPEATSRVMARVEAGDAALTRFSSQVSNPRMEVTGLAGGRRSVLSRVYLIEQARREVFLAEVERTSEALAAEGITLLQSGPWPPARS